MNTKEENKILTQERRPYWRAKDEYAYLLNADLAQFSWEFLRRNAKYQKAFRKYKDFPTYKYLMENKDNTLILHKYFSCFPPCEEGESLATYEKRALELVLSDSAYKKQATYIKPKRNEFIDAYDLAFHEDTNVYNYRVQSSPGFDRFGPEYPVFSKFRKKGHKRTLTEDYEDEIVVKINVRLNTGDQLEVIKKAIDDRKKSLPTLPFYKDDPDLYIQYLRLLDAKKQKAPEEEILFHLYYIDFVSAAKKDSGYILPEKPSDLITTDDNRFSKDKRPPKKMEGNLSKAIELRDGGYVSMARSFKHFSL